jgi:hypothetical protein
MNTATEHQTLADAWIAHADRTLPIDVSQAQCTRARRDWYYEQLLELKDQPPSTKRDALLAEALGFARAIGTAAETATA